MSCSTRSSASYVARPKRRLSNGFTAVSAPEDISTSPCCCCVGIRVRSADIFRDPPRYSPIGEWVDYVQCKQCLRESTRRTFFEVSP